MSGLRNALLYRKELPQEAMVDHSQAVGSVKLGKGKPWTVKEEKQLRKLSEVVVQTRSAQTTTSLQLSNDLPGVEGALRILAAALKASAEPGLD